MSKCVSVCLCVCSPPTLQSHDVVPMCGRLRRYHIITCLSAAVCGEITRLRAFPQPFARTSPDFVPTNGRLWGNHVTTCLCAAARSRDDVPTCGRLRGVHTMTCLSVAASGEGRRLRAYVRPPAGGSHDYVLICNRLRGKHTITCLSAAACQGIT